MTETKANHQAGKRVEMLIDGHKVVVGFNIVRGQPCVAFVPPTRWRPSPDDPFPVDGEKFTVKEVRQSTGVPHMIVIDLDKVEEAANG